jgi:hypothetical protein
MVESEWNRIVHLLQSSAAGSSMYCKMVKPLFACQEAEWDVHLGWFAESHENIVE